MDYLETIGIDTIHQHGRELIHATMEKLSEVRGLRVLGPPLPAERATLAAFTIDGTHPHDLVEYANTKGIALRGGHHCTQPLMRRFQVPGTSRASFYFYNTHQEVDRLVEVLHQAVKFFS